MSGKSFFSASVFFVFILWASYIGNFSEFWSFDLEDFFRGCQIEIHPLFFHRFFFKLNVAFNVPIRFFSAGHVKIWPTFFFLSFFPLNFLSLWISPGGSWTQLPWDIWGFFFVVNETCDENWSRGNYWYLCSDAKCYILVGGMGYIDLWFHAFITKTDTVVNNTWNASMMNLTIAGFVVDLWLFSCSFISSLDSIDMMTPSRMSAISAGVISWSSFVSWPWSEGRKSPERLRRSKDRLWVLQTSQKEEDMIKSTEK